EVALEPRPAGDHERVTVAEPGLERRKVDALREQRALLAQVPERVLGERPERLGDASELLAERALEVVLGEDLAGSKAGSVPEHASAGDRQRLALRHRVEEPRPLCVDQPDAAANEEERARIRKAAALGRGDVDDAPDARLEELLRGHAVEVDVVDDRDVPRRQ